MIFSHGLDDKVRDGSKIQTRRLVKPGDIYFAEFFEGAIHGVQSNGRLKWEVGKTYAIQSGRGKKGNGRFRITKIRKESLQSITDADARAEGVSKIMTNDAEWWTNEATVSFKRLWNSIHKKLGARWEDLPEVWVLEIEPANGR